MHYLLFYTVADDYLARRGAFRKAHLELAWRAAARGELVLGGALANPPDAAILLFQGDSPAAAEAFAREDPYVRNGVVVSWKVREWTTVAGAGAATPVRPESL
ncbi:MAG TPA: YciI-like protein [Planctomycetota bacterium]